MEACWGGDGVRGSSSSGGGGGGGSSSSKGHGFSE